MIIFESEHQKYIIGGESPIIGAVEASSVLGFPEFKLKVIDKDDYGTPKPVYRFITIAWDGSDTIYRINGKKYILKSDQDTINFHSVVEAAYIEEILR